MANISAIKLPNGTTYNLKDSVSGYTTNTGTITKVKTTAGAHSTINVSSGTASFNVPTKTSHLTNDSGFLTSVANGSHSHSPDTIYIPTNYAKTGSIDLLSATKIGSYMSNKSFAIPPEAITIEYSTNGGSTWQDYGATDLHKRGLFAETRNNCNTFLGKATTKKANSLNNQLRITISRINLGRYTAINSFYTWMTTNGNTVYCKLERSLNSSPTVFETVFTDFKLAGWSGHNIRYFPTMAFGGGNNDQPYALRLTVWQTAITTNYPSANLYDIRFYGPDTYSASAPYYKVQTNELYTWDNTLNAIFPAGITATSFSGNLTGNVTGNVSGTAGGVAWANVSSKPTATGSKVTGITASTTATKTTLGTAFTIPNVTSAGSASTWAFEEITIPNVTSAGSASTWSFSDVTVPIRADSDTTVPTAASSATACDDITAWSAGSGSYTQGSFSGGSGSFSATVTNHVLSFSHTHTAATHGNDSHTHTAPSLSYTARSITGVSGSTTVRGVKTGTSSTTTASKASGANGSAPTLGTAIKVQSKKSGANSTAPTLGTAFTVPNVTGNTSATVSITDNGHTHSI